MDQQLLKEIGDQQEGIVLSSQSTGLLGSLICDEELTTPMCQLQIGLQDKERVTHSKFLSFAKNQVNLDTEILNMCKEKIALTTKKTASEEFLNNELDKLKSERDLSEFEKIWKDLPEIRRQIDGYGTEIIQIDEKLEELRNSGRFGFNVARLGLMHIGVFILLLLSSERNFGVRLNKPYTATVPMDIPGSHADLLVTVFDKIIATGHQRLTRLFDCLLTILVNVSPYLKILSMVATIKLLHLLEAFSTPWFLFSSPSKHHLVFFLLEIFNNIIQYQFDGNSNLVYTIIRKRHVFHALANLPSDYHDISKCLNSRKGIRTQSRHVSPPPTEERATPSPVGEESSDGDNKSEIVANSMEGSKPALPAEPNTKFVSLLDTPDIGLMTERESAHLDSSPFAQFAPVDDSELVNDLDEASAQAVIAPPVQASLKEPSPFKRAVTQRGSIRVTPTNLPVSSPVWNPTPEWVSSWRVKLPLQTIMRLLQVLVPQVEKICIDKGLTDESEILKFLQHGTLVGLLPVPHPILIRKYQANNGTTAWFRTYMWGVIYLRNVDPAIWYDTEVKLFEIQRV